MDLISFVPEEVHLFQKSPRLDGFARAIDVLRIPFWNRIDKQILEDHFDLDLGSFGVF